MDSRILLVEDDPSIREVTAMGLGAAGFAVTTAADGSRPRDVFGPSRTTSSCSTSCCRGSTASRSAARSGKTSTVPVVMLTARGDTMDVVVGLEAGADDYVRKPFDLPELIARIRAALRRAGGAAADGPTELRIGPLVIDVAGRTVARDGADVPLTRTEFDLLHELVRHAGQVLSRDVLLDRVWGYDYLGDSRLVDVAIQRLRAKIEADPAAPELIHTVRGAGYKAVR